MFKFPPNTQVCIFYCKCASRADYTEFSACVPFDPVPSTSHLVKVHQSSSLQADDALSKFPGPVQAFCCPSAVEAPIQGHCFKMRRSLMSNVMLNFTCKHIVAKNVWANLGKREENELLLSYYCGQKPWCMIYILSSNLCCCCCSVT